METINLLEIEQEFNLGLELDAALFFDKILPPVDEFGNLDDFELTAPPSHRFLDLGRWSTGVAIFKQET